MTRIIAGSARGRRLAVPPGAGTRPTADRVREALFSAIQSRLGPLSGCRVADLYAGSGALGLEALSRGAAHALFVESEQKAIRVLRDNIATLGLSGAEVRAQAVSSVVAAAPVAPYDVVMLDPPYRADALAVQSVLTHLVDHSWLVDDALVVIERGTRGGAFEWPTGLMSEGERKYGETTLWYGRRAEPVDRQGSATFPDTSGS